MDSDRNARSRQETEPFPTITPVPSNAAAGPSTYSTTTTTTTTTTTAPASGPATTVTTTTGPRRLSRGQPAAARPHASSTPQAPSLAFNAPPRAPPPTAQPNLLVRPAPANVRRPSVRLRRQTSARPPSWAPAEGATTSQPTSYAAPPTAGPSSRPPGAALPNINEDAIEANRKRSSSEPQRPAWVLAQDDSLVRSTTAQQPSLLPPVAEEGSHRDGMPPVGTAVNPAELLAVPQQDAGIMRRLSVGARNAMKRRSVGAASARQSSQVEEEELDPRLVDILDVVDPEVSTLSTLTNVQNSLFIPDLGPLLNRQPTYVISRRPTTARRPTALRQPSARPQPPLPDIEKPPETDIDTDTDEARPQLTHTSTISSTLTDSHYAVLPHGTSLAGWTAEEKEELNDHVRHMLHSKRSAFSRGLKGFGQYVRRPLGFFVTLYAVLITLFGAAWVLFLIGWINLGSRRLYIINVIDNILVALFAVMGDGLAPFRAWDTYNTVFVVHFWRLTRKLRKKKQLPKLKNKNDLPTRTVSETAQGSDLELEPHDLSMKDEENGDPEGFGEGKDDEYTVLSDKQQASLELHQRRLARSHTFYKPHETVTHHAFPISYLLAIIILCDLHSMLQITLGTCTWAISYHVRPFALTTVILCCSITCNITAGVVIAIGDRRSRKKDVIERMFRQELTATAMKKVEKRRVKTMERDDRDGLMGSVIHEEPSASSTERRSMDRLRGGVGKLKKATIGPASSSTSQSEDNLQPQGGNVPGINVHTVR